MNTDSVPTYVVYRDTKPGSPDFDPTSPLLFFPPKGSDELFDALRVAFPNVKTHSERMRDAMIQYLLEERQQEEQLASPTATMDTMANTTWPSMSSDSNSTWSSPELLNFPTPGASFSNSPQLAPQLTRQASVATSSQPSPSGPSLDQMTGVFCLSTSSQPKQRVRRKMTDAEKAEYRKRRIVKACDKCAKRKRKCPHNQAEMANVPNKPTSRAAKASSKSATPPSSAQNQQMAFDSSMTLDDLANSFDPSEFFAFNDFNMFEDTTPEFDMNDMINWNQADLFTPDVSPVQRDWSYSSQTEDFTLLDPRVSSHGELGNMSFVPRQTHGDTLYNHNSGGEQQPFDNLRRFANFEDIHNFPGASGLEQQGHREDTQQQQHTTGASYNGGNGMLWEHLRTGQPEPNPEKPVPTHTAHVHDAESEGLHDLNSPTARPQDPCRQPTLPQTVLKLTGTTRAVRSLTRLLCNRPQQPSSIAIDKIVDALRDRDQLACGQLLYLRSHGTNSVPAHLQRSLFQVPRLRDAEKRASAQPGEVNLASSGPLQEVGEASRRKVALSLLGESSTPLTSTSVSVSRGSLTRSAAAAQGWPQQQQPLAELNGVQEQVRSSLPGRQQPSLGEGIPEDANAASDLYMARRRISPRHHRYTVVNASASVNAGIPGTDELYINRSSKAAIPTAESRTVDSVRLETRSTRILPGEIETTFSTASQANGGAYLRLEEKDAAVHTRPRNPTASGFGGDTDQHHDFGSADVVVASASSTAQAVQNGLQAHEERLLDHVRFRDHHGRTMLVSTALLISFFMLAMAGMLTPSLALLALISLEKENEAATCWYQRCSTKNSTWLSTYATMQLASVGSSSRARGNEKGKETLGKAQVCSAWMKGLMYPFAFAPLRFAVGA